MKRGIEVEFQRIDNVLIGKCNFMPEKLRGNLDLFAEGYVIASKEDIGFYDESYLSIRGSDKKTDNLSFAYDYETIEEAVKAQKMFQKLIYQFNKEYCEEKILDDIEKEYLENVLRPLRCKEVQIQKVSYIDNTESIAIHHRNILNETDVIDFPPFKKGTMYKNMKIHKCYTPKELGLFEEAQA